MPHRGTSGRPAPGRAGSSGATSRIRRVELPKRRLRKTFALVGEVVESATTAALSVRYSQDDAASVLFDIALLGRGVNTLKAVRLLCENAHWEMAMPAARQLFEVLVNLEYIEAEPDRAAARLRYQRFGLLQMARQTEANLEYDQKTGRPVDEEVLATAKSLLARAFTEFRIPRKNRAWVWARSWSGRSTKQLAEASQAPIRMDQYRLLFAAWSEQTHASPSVLLPGMFMDGGDAASLVATDDLRIAETVASAVTLFLELWTLLPTIPGPDPAAAARWYGWMLEDAVRHGATMQQDAGISRRPG